MLSRPMKRMTPNPRDSTLRLAGFSIKPDLERWIRYCNANMHIKNIQFGNNKLSNDDAFSLGAGLHTILGEINLVYNSISNNGVKQIAKALTNTWKCDSLNLSFNNIGDSGIKAIAYALASNTHLTCLNICDNEAITFTALEYLLYVIERYNTTLVTLFFYNKSLGGRQFNIIRDRFNAHRYSVVSRQSKIAFMLCVDALGFSMITENLISSKILSMMTDLLEHETVV